MGASKTRSEVLPPTWRFADWEQWSGCVLSRSLLSVGFSSLCDLHLKEPGGGRVESKAVQGIPNTCSAFLLSYKHWCQSVFLSPSNPGILECGCVLVAIVKCNPSDGKWKKDHTVLKSVLPLTQAAHTLRILLMDTPKQPFVSAF